MRSRRAFWAASRSTSAALEIFAKATNRSKSYITIRAIAGYVQRNAWQMRQAAQEAEEVLFVVEETVDAWLDNWNELSPSRSNG
jgi:predicted transcriptional regulator